MGEYSKAAILKYTRKYMKMTQEELAESICEPGTLIRYETGKIEPPDEKFYALLKKMGMENEICTIPIHHGVSEYEKVMKSILHAFECRDYSRVSEAIQCLKEDEQFAQAEYIQKQYVKRIELILAYENKQIDRDYYLNELINTLRLTFPQFQMEKFMIHRVFSEIEISLINSIALLYQEEKEYEKAISLYKNVEDYFETGIVVNDYKPRYICLVNYSNCLGLAGHYDESIEICKKGINWLLLHNKGNFLYIFYFNIGWNIKKKVDNRLEETCKMREAQCYIWVALQLCRMYPENIRNLEKIENFYEEISD